MERGRKSQNPLAIAYLASGLSLQEFVEEAMKTFFPNYDPPPPTFGGPSPLPPTTKATRPFTT
ncbi:hypothetical protein HPB48_020478 [Haemaphysalis longicornis]|uniref:Uncharacterized protein n=1 Tax=Haemaphysalis longicornis TaxID=44386 RepID=A0A9J6FEA8_HAELO|nr:hypothetical protein HPB48_020478 [Haemaphysalis longicornis]